MVSSYMRKFTHGWIPDLPDHRDFQFVQRQVQLPTSVDLRPQCPPVYDQGQLGSCTGNAWAGAMEFEQMLQKEPNITTPSRLYIYYKERLVEHTVGSDSGAQIRDGIKVLAKYGVCPESVWPYDVAKFTVKPPKVADTAAKVLEAVQYSRIDNRNVSNLMNCLAAGRPFVFGFSVYESFESEEVAKTGIVPMPGKSESLLGGHAVMAVGYDANKKVFLVRNSWGDAWGQKGYFTIPFAYLSNLNLADDFWTLEKVS